MRPDLFVNIEIEEQMLKVLPKVILSDYPHLTPDNTLVLMVSPDYSASAAMHVAHGLSKDGEMCSILPIHVPYPDDKEIDRWIERAKTDLHNFHVFEGRYYDNYLLVEAGVIKGGTYTWLTDLLRKTVIGKIITVTLFENIHSKFKSDVVLKYYNDLEEDLTFYYEKYNKHWL
jgi:hypothetical protein